MTLARPTVTMSELRDVLSLATDGRVGSMANTVVTWARDAVFLAGIVVALAIWLPIAALRLAHENLRIQFARAEG